MEPQPLELLYVQLPHLVVLLVVNHRVPGEQRNAPRTQVFAQDAQVLDVLDAEDQHRRLRRNGFQCPQVCGREGSKPRQAKRAPGVQRLQQRVPDPFDAFGVDQDARALFGGQAVEQELCQREGVGNDVGHGGLAVRPDCREPPLP